MQIVNQSTSFGPLSGSGPQTRTVTATFPSIIAQATAILTGFTVEFSGGDDHHLGQLECDVTVTGVSGPNASVQVRLGLRDWSGNWDDNYDGTVNFSVIGE